MDNNECSRMIKAMGLPFNKDGTYASLNVLAVLQKYPFLLITLLTIVEDEEDPKMATILARRIHFQNWYYDRTSTRKDFLCELIDIMYDEYLARLEALKQNDQGSEYNEDVDDLDIEQLLTKYNGKDYVSINMFSSKTKISKLMKKYECLLSEGVPIIRELAQEDNKVLPFLSDVNAGNVTYEHSRYLAYVDWFYNTYGVRDKFFMEEIKAASHDHSVVDIAKKEGIEIPKKIHFKNEIILLLHEYYKEEEGEGKEKEENEKGEEEEEEKSTSEEKSISENYGSEELKVENIEEKVEEGESKEEGEAKQENKEEEDKEEENKEEGKDEREKEIYEMNLEDKPSEKIIKQEEKTTEEEEKKEQTDNNNQQPKVEEESKEEKDKQIIKEV